MRSLLVMVLFSSGCGAALTTITPKGVTLEPTGTHLHEVEYELLGQVNGEACGTADRVKESHQFKSPDPRAIYPQLLYEEAKFNALGTQPNADELAAVRAKAEQRGDQICVQIVGRALRMQTLRAVGSGTREERRPLPPPTAIESPQPMPTAPTTTTPPARKRLPAEDRPL